jgi:hypothetical protein
MLSGCDQRNEAGRVTARTGPTSRRQHHGNSDRAPDPSTGTPTGTDDARAFNQLVDDIGDALDDVAMIITQRSFPMSNPRAVGVLRDLVAVASAMARLRRPVIRAVDAED